MFEIYKPSGRFGLMALPLAVLGIVGAVAAAYVYQLGLEWIPLIYITFLLTWFFGIGLGMAGSLIVDWGKIRSVAFAGLLGLLMTLAAVSGKFYFQYQAMMSATVAEVKKDPEAANLTNAEIRKLLGQELTFMKHIELRVDQGWQIGRPGRNGGGLPLAGFLVYLIWLLELGILGYSAISMPMSSAAEPYSEKLDEWASEEEVVMTLPVTNDEMVRQIEAATTVDELMQIPIPKTDQSDRFAVYRVNSIEGQELEDAYLSVDLLELSLNNEGEQETKTKPLVKHAVFSSAQRKQLIENASLLNEAMADYRESLAHEEAEAVDVELINHDDTDHA